MPEAQHVPDIITLLWYTAALSPAEEPLKPRAYLYRHFCFKDTFLGVLQVWASTSSKDNVYLCTQTKQTFLVRKYTDVRFWKWWCAGKSTLAKRVFVYSLPVTLENKTVQGLQENRKHPNFIVPHIIPEIFPNMHYKTNSYIKTGRKGYDFVGFPSMDQW